MFNIEIARWIELVVLLVLAGGGIGAAIWSWRSRGQAQRELMLHWHGWQMQRFGLPSDGEPIRVEPVGPIRSHRMLRQRVTRKQPSRENRNHRRQVQAILQDDRGDYWFILFENQIPPFARITPQAVRQSQAPLVLRINELRARRALFNDAAAYRQAFGEEPTRAGLDAFRKRHPEQEPGERNF